MNIAGTIKNNFISRYRVLTMAIAISLAWHLLVLSAVKVVSSPMPKSIVKFSKVAFLGPILSKVSMDLRASPAGGSLLELRYRDTVIKMAGSKPVNDNSFSPFSDGFQSTLGDDPAYLGMVDEALSREKPEPDYQDE